MLLCMYIQPSSRGHNQEVLRPVRKTLMNHNEQMLTRIETSSRFEVLAQLDSLAPLQIISD